jgi:hypothetical protein
VRTPDLAWLLAPALLGPGCGDDVASTTDTTDTTDTSTGTSTGELVTTGDDPGATGPSYESPDCTQIVLPGDPADLALTPRPDRDAEVLALRIDPSLAVAPQARYEVIAGDLAAIRALAPELAAIHENCAYPNGIQMWFWSGMQPLMLAALGGSYRGWDCHNAAYKGKYVHLIDGIAIAFRVEGVYSDVVRDAYAALPGFEQVEVRWCWPDSCPSIACEAAGSISLTHTLDGEGALDTREYRFESPELGVTVYRVSPGQAPELIE